MDEIEPAPAKGDFYPRPPCGGRHPPGILSCRRQRLFLSTPSVRRATISRSFICATFFVISIHALRAEGDRLRG